MTREYTHELHIEVRSISGGYCMDEEGTVDVEGRSVLYVLGNAVVDSACCGSYGCRFALVPGFVVKWKHMVDGGGTPVSEVEPIRDERLKKIITHSLQERSYVSQVQFW